MYKFNMLLFNQLFENKNTNIAKVSTMTGIPYSTIFNWASDYSRIPVWGVVDICNALRISISALVTNDERWTVSALTVEPIPEEIFQPLIYDETAVGNIYKKNGWVNTTKKDFSERLGVYDATINNWIRNRKALRMNTLIDICNQFDLNINRFIIDSNRKAEPPTLKGANNAIGMFNQMKNELETLRTDNVKKRKLIEDMQSELESIKEENKSLKLKGIMLREYKPYESVQTIASDSGALYRPNRDALLDTNAVLTPLMEKRTKYVFNKYLFKSLPELTGIGIESIAALCKLSPVYIEEGSDKFRISRLIALCNRLHISIRHFFLPEGELYMIGKPEEYFLDATDFCRISLLPDNIAALSGDNGLLGISRSVFCDAIGISLSSLSMWIKEEKQSSISVSGLLRICNTYHIAPDLFFQDNNENIPYSYPITPESMLFTENLLLKKIIKEQEKK